MTKKTGWIKTGLFLLPALLLFSGAAAAAQFSAAMMIKDGAKVIPGKIFVQDGKLRQEFNDKRGHTVTIVRPDLKVVWIILPQKQAYLELPLGRRLPGQFIQIPPHALSKRPLGQETVNGYEAAKYQVMVRGRLFPDIQDFWVATKLATPIKMTAKGGKFSVDYQNIKEGAQPDRLFNLPPGYRKLKSRARF
jgi:hypothetical protein